MKTLCVPATNPLYELVIEYGIPYKIFYPERYNVTYRKIWPSPDGLYEPPKFERDSMFAEGVISYLNQYVDPEIAREVRSKIGLLVD